MSNIPSPGQIYRHFKGNLYRIVTLAKHTETNEELVIYQALYGAYEVYARPLSMFVEKIDKSKHPDVVSEYRFELQKELIAEPVTEAGVDKNEPLAEESMADAVESFSAEVDGQPEELNIDPLVLEFLDVGTYEERLNILSALQHRITDDMINTMALAVDVEIGEGDTQDRLEELRTCLLTLQKYECSRIR
ncbi:MAG: DUF1653 domain-containing protein [Lachnospiraceae bacterium]|nr:DUF1653 domain-containing protein [Lachnospiraceae bacterium]MDE6186274.1 DUF1653 domain-containing protein [Lachnospiraceae bacterium]